MQHHFDIEIANKYGVNVAIFLNHIAYWINFNKSEDRNFRDDRYWTYNKTEAFAKIFPYWSIGQIERIINKCIKFKLLLRIKPNGYDRISWYSLTDEAAKLLNISIYRFQQIHLPKTRNGFTENEKCIYTDINTDTNKDQTEEIVIPEFVDKSLFERFKKYRKKIKKPMTDDAIKLLINKLTKLHDKGLNINELLEEAIINGWQGVWELRYNQGKHDNYSNNDHAPRSSVNRMKEHVSERNIIR